MDVPHQHDGLRHFMVGFHEEHCVDAVGREQRVIALAPDSADIGQLLLLGAITDVMEAGYEPFVSPWDYAMNRVLDRRQNQPSADQSLNHSLIRAAQSMFALLLAVTA